MRCATLLLLCVALVAVATASALAVDGTWAVDASGNWSDSSKWEGGTLAGGEDSTAYFSCIVTGSRTVTLDAPRTIGNLSFSQSPYKYYGYTVASSNPATNVLTMSVTGGGMPTIYTDLWCPITISAPLAGKQGIAFANDYVSLVSSPYSIMLSGANTYTGGTVINSGGVTFASTAAVPTSGLILINYGGYLDGTSGAASQATWLTNNKIDTSSTGGLKLSGSTAVNFSNYAKLGIVGTYSGTITPGANGYRFGCGSALAATSISTTIGSILGDYNGVSTALTSVDVVTLAGANTYTGATTVEVGTLKLSSTGSISNSSRVQVNSGATFDVSAKNAAYAIAVLSGAGTAKVQDGKSLTVAELLPGDSGIGTLTVGSTKDSVQLILANNAVYDYEVGGTTASPTSDLMYIGGGTGTLSFGANATLKLSNLAGSALDPTDQTFVLFNYAGANPTLPNWTIDYGTTGWTGGVISVNTIGTQIELTGLVVAVPEPGTLALLATGLAGLLAYALRKRK